MTEIEIIKELFKAASSKHELSVVMTDNSRRTGVIQLFDGDRIFLDDIDIPISSIIGIEYPENINSDIAMDEIEELQDYSSYKMKHVQITTSDNACFEGIIFDCVDNKIVLITSTNKVVISTTNIIEINDISDAENDARENNQQVSDDYTVTSFEKALLDCDKERVDYYFLNPASLVSDGYTEEEIKKITKSASVPLPWNDNEVNRKYNQARRIYSLEGNRGGLAKQLFQEFLQSNKVPYKLRVKAINSLIDLLGKSNDTALLVLFEENNDLIMGHELLCFNTVKALVKMGLFDKARMIIDESEGSVNFDDILFSLNYYENHRHYDLSKLPGLNALDPNVGVKEIRHLLNLPERSSFVQLLVFYNKHGRLDSFFALLDLFMPYAKNDVRIVSIVKECLKKDSEGTYLASYLPDFVTLWLDKELAKNYLDICGNDAGDNKKKQRLINQCKRTKEYELPNELETSIINENYQLFDALRGNGGILLSMGYSLEEAKALKGFDIDSIKYGNKSAFEKLLLLEGNRNYIAESIAGPDFLKHPETVGELLFQILIDEKNGDLLYELYNYNPYIKGKLHNQKILYLKSLLLIEEKEEFWNQIKEDWLDLDLDKDMILAARTIALENGHKDLADVMLMRANHGPFNEFENALIEGNAPKLRMLATDANYLLDEKYSSDEIKLIQESIKQRIDLASSDHYSIANRLYAFQKNKNRAAEFFYKLALSEEKLAAAGLFSILLNEKRYVELCELFEDHLSNSADGVDINQQEIYLKALYCSKQYEKYIDYLKENRGLVTNSLYDLVALIETEAPTKEIENSLIVNTNIDEDTFEDAKKCLSCISENFEKLSECEEPVRRILVKLYNDCFAYCSPDDFQELRTSLLRIPNRDWEIPSGIGIQTFLAHSSNYTELKRWCMYLFANNLRSDAQVAIIKNLVHLYASDNKEFHEFIRELLMPLKKDGVAVPSELKQYLYPRLDDYSEKLAWLDEKLNSRIEDTDESEFMFICQIANEIGDNNKLFKFLYAISDMKLSFADSYLKVVFSWLEDSINRKSEISDDLIGSIENQMKYERLGVKEMAALFDAYLNIGKYEYAFLAECSLSSRTILDDDQKEYVELLRNILKSRCNMDLFTIIESKLEGGSIQELDHLCGVWGNYLKISEKDTNALGEIRDYYNLPTKWSEEAKVSLAKHVICKTSVPMYWKLLSVLFSDSNDNAKCNIQYHLALAEGGSLDKVLLDAAKQNLRINTIEVLMGIASEASSSSFERSYEAIDLIIDKYSDWLTDKKIALKVIYALHKNELLKKDLRTWIGAATLAMRVAFIGNVEREFFDLFKESFGLELELVNLQFLCGLLLERPDYSQLISDSRTVLNHSSKGIPYRELIYEILNDNDGCHFSETQCDILKIARDNKGGTIDESLLYKYYMSSVSQGRKTIALDALKKINEYYSDLSVIADVEKYELVANDISDHDIMQIYASEFEALKEMANSEKVEKVIINMIPGELYLKSKQYDVDSVIEYGISTSSSRMAERIRSREYEYKSLDDIFESSKRPDLPYLFMKCAFTRQWRDFITYELKDVSINEIIRSDSVIKNLLFKKSYEVLKSAVIAILNSEPDDEDVIDRADAVIVATGGIQRSKNYLRRIQKMSDEQKTILRRVFSVRIESRSLRDSGIAGSTIIDIPGNELVAYLIGMLGSRGLAALFDNAACMKQLMHMPDDRAYSIAEVYSTFFYQGVDNVFARFIAAKQSTPFESFASDDPFEEKIDYCKDSRKWYQISQNKISKSDGPVSKTVLKTYELNKLAFLYDSVVYNSEQDLMYLNPTEMDYLTTVTYLFNKRTVNEIRKYVWNLDISHAYSIYAMVLILLEQYQEAYDAIKQVKEEDWKKALLQILYRDLNLSSGEEKSLRHSIQQEITIEQKYFIGRFFPINSQQLPEFIEKMKDLRSFLAELLDYMSFNGVEYPKSLINDSKFKLRLNEYIGKCLGKGDDIGGVNSNTQNNETVIQIIESCHVERFLNESIGVDPVQKLKKNPEYEDYLAVLKYMADARGSSHNNQDVLRTRDLIRWLYITLMDKEGYDRESLNYVLLLISEKDSISKRQMDAIMGYLQTYFEKIGDILQLSRMIENDISGLRNISKMSNSQIMILRSEDIKSWDTIADTLSVIAGMDFARMSEPDQISRLSACRQKLYNNGENKNSSLFDQINNELLRLLTSYILKLRHNPELSIEIIGEEEDGTQSLTWETGNDKGTLYAIIGNIGGADCKQVKLTSTINMVNRRSAEIKTIYSGERIPFFETFNRNDLSDGKVSWNIELTYYDSERDRNITINHETRAEVQIGGEPLNLGNISTGNPARGKNFVGRKRELTLLRNRYSEIDQLPSMLVRGLKRSGKSSIIINFADEIRKQNKIIVSVVDGQSVGGNIRKAFVDKVLDGVYASYKNNLDYREIIEGPFESFRNEWKEKDVDANWISRLDTFYYELNGIFNKKVLVIIDEMESVFYNHRFDSVDQEETLYAALRALIQNADNYVSFIFCGSDTLLTSCLEQRRESQMFQTLQYLEVGRMNFGDIREIFRQQSEKYDIEFTKDAIDTIWEYTHGLVWYAKLLGYLVINNIFANDLTIRKEVNRADIVTAVQMLINGEIGTDKFDLVDASLSTPRAAIVHAMANIMPDYNKELSVDEICASLHMMKMEGYTNPRTGEHISDTSEKDVQKNMDFLEKMQFVNSNASRTKYQFTAELYRLFFREDKRLHLFEERSN